jgi:hypothetical protein
LQAAFYWRKVGTICDISFSYCDIGLAFENWLDQFGYIFASILVVAIGTDDNICS